MKKVKIDVRFLVHEHPNECDEIFAFFPNDINDPYGYKTCYAHMGQHSGCCDEYAAESRKATEEEYTPLLRELEDLVGYDVTILK